MKEKPNYYAIIPAEVRYDTRLKANEKLIYGEITALTYKTGECWASNSYFSKLYNTSSQAVSRWILNLKKYGYINIDYEYSGKEITKRIILVSTNIYTYQQNDDGGINKYTGGYQQNVKENNTSINNTSINKRELGNVFFENQEINNLFIEFLEMRRKLKAINSDRAIQILINKLNTVDDSDKKIMINKSIENSWKGLFPIKQENNNNNNNNKKTFEEMYELVN